MEFDHMVITRLSQMMQADTFPIAGLIRIDDDVARLRLHDQGFTDKKRGNTVSQAYLQAFLRFILRNQSLEKLPFLKRNFRIKVKNLT
ncbi:MAG: hypothetical protein A3C36_02925 [Omnitrophica WOR_2 bacterium RIFCSPHIGHO2_02_FULL_52_10]|nr:MAG: hypothetical protein A3C36_02925 [Omnitrophica WOR_2 bacterium RIFCSPHIGHO2_02_FULL_52_10]